MDHHVLAAISLTGTILDALGGFYLAYDLLGGKDGPLRTLSGVITYSVLFIPFYSVALGLRFGIIAGGGLGLALGIEYRRLDRRGRSRQRSLLFALVRGFFLGAAACAAFGVSFGARFGVFTFLALGSTYWFGFSPTDTYAPGARPRVTRRILTTAILRAIAMSTAGALAGLTSGESGRALAFGISIGAVAGMVSMVVGTLSPMVEWHAETIPPRVLGTAGAVLILCGFVLQSTQYVVALADIPVQ